MVLASLLFCVVLAVTWSHSNSSTPKIFYMQVSGVFNNPFLLETKALCASRGFLKSTFVSEKELGQLPPLASSLVTQLPPTGIRFRFSNSSNASSKTSNGSSGLSLKEDNLILRNYRGYAVSKRHWEFNGQPVWQGFVYEREMQVPKVLVTLDNEVFLFHATSHTVNTTLYELKSFDNAQSWLKEQIGRMKIWSFPSLIDLFSEGKLSSNLFTKEILRHIKSIPVYRTRDLAYTVFEGYILTDVSRYNSAKVKNLLANERQYSETAIWRKVEQFETLYRAMFHWWSYDGVKLHLKAFRLSMAREKFYLVTYDETMALFDAAHKCFIKKLRRRKLSST